MMAKSSENVVGSEFKLAITENSSLQYASFKKNLSK